MPYTYKHPRPSLTVDIIVFSIISDDLKILLVERGGQPFKGDWALPGGFVQMNESLEDAAKRELHEETNVHGIYLEQLYAWGSPDRDPRGRVVSVSYLALIPSDSVTLESGTDAEAAKWKSWANRPALAFDHEKIASHARKVLIDNVLRGEPKTAKLVFELLPRMFSLTDLQTAVEIITLEHKDKRNFRSWANRIWNLRDTGKQTSGGQHRPAKLYFFDGIKQ